VKIRALTTSVFALVWAGFAMATPPFIETYPAIEDLFITSCSSFDVRARGSTIYTEKTFFNKAGEAVRWRLSGHITESIYYNSTDDSIFVTQGAKGVGENFLYEVDLVTGATHIAGGLFRLTLPGIGHVVMFMGVEKVDADGNAVFHGLYAFPEGNTAAALCEALAS